MLHSLCTNNNRFNHLFVYIKGSNCNKASFLNIKCAVREELISKRCIHCTNAQITLGGILKVRIHIVQKGDTLWKLAKKYDTDPDQIQATNPTIVNPEMLMPGMKIKVPTATVAVRKEKVIEPKQEKIKPLNKPEVKQPQVKTKNDEWNLDAPPKKQMTQEVQKNVKTTDKGPLPPKPPCQPCQSGNMTNKQMSGHQMNKWNQQNMTQQEMPRTWE
ncbi:YrbA protein [Bacillus sp. JCM 19045]|nr:YrbA protein [Bacillus sp. JCM 19045]